MEHICVEKGSSLVQVQALLLLLLGETITNKAERAGKKLCVAFRMNKPDPVQAKMGKKRQKEEECEQKFEAFIKMSQTQSAKTKRNTAKRKTKPREK